MQTIKLSRPAVACWLALSLAGLASPVMAQDLPLRGVTPLEVQVDPRPLTALDTDAVVVPIFDGEDPTATIVRPAAPPLAAAIAAARTQQASGSGAYGGLSIFAPGGLATPRLVLMNAGAEKELDGERLRRLAGAAVRQLRSQQVRSVAFWVRGSVAPAEAATAVTTGAHLGHFDPGLHKSGAAPSVLASLRIAGLGTTPNAAAVERGAVLARAQNLARSLTVEPSNFMTPDIMAQHARQIGRESGLEVEIFDETRIAGMGMGGVMAVAQGASFPPRFIVLRYKAPQGSSTTLALAGKGVTFDSGGISLKPGAGMYRMKGDMAGGAAVLGAMMAIAAVKPAVNVMGVVPAVMNLPSGTAQRPGDVFKSLSGKTVEVMSTDAEGRMILSDALTYAVRQGATHIVDIATLTGAVITALGDVHTGAFSSNDTFFGDLTRAAARSGETFWRLPIDDDYGRGIRSSLVADLNETGGSGGASVGAKFIQQFTEGRPWIHLDIAGTSWPDARAPHMADGPTGVTVRTLTELALLLGGPPAPTPQP